MVAANTFGNNVECSYTRIGWSEEKVKTQIDFLFVSSNLAGIDIVKVVNDKFIGFENRLGNSDHYPIIRSFMMRDKSITHSYKSSGMTGYKITDPEKAKDVGKFVMDKFGFDGCNDVLTTLYNPFAHLQQCITEVATSIPHTTMSQRVCDGKSTPPELRAAKRQRLMAPPGSVERVIARREENRLKRKWKAISVLRNGKKKKHGGQMMQLQLADGSITCDRDKWKAEVFRHCSEKYSEQTLDDDTVEKSLC